MYKVIHAIEIVSRDIATTCLIKCACYETLIISPLNNFKKPYIQSLKTFKKRKAKFSVPGNQSKNIRSNLYELPFQESPLANYSRFKITIYVKKSDQRQNISVMFFRKYILNYLVSLKIIFRPLPAQKVLS